MLAVDTMWSPLPASASSAEVMAAWPDATTIASVPPSSDAMRFSATLPDGFRWRE
jgi:hypothetical protein